ncbi:hypothetical protein [Microvirga sp. TS319]|uniref:hypothetical protein n=1 Tax=Microvirga sp. TS319 TaxID=3241165 RepID=UPI00351A96DB
MIGPFQSWLQPISELLDEIKSGYILVCCAGEAVVITFPPCIECRPTLSDRTPREMDRGAPEQSAVDRGGMHVGISLR